MTILLALLAAVALPLLVIVLMYNGLVARKNSVDNAFGGMDVQLKKRYDLIPNLVNTVKQYMKHEADTLTRIAALRARAASGGLSDDQKIDLDNQITAGLTGLMVAVENYPELKANENFMKLQRTLNEVEAQISAARRAYNAAVTAYNNSVEMFPSNLLARMMGYLRKPVFEIPDPQRQNINVGALFGS